MGQRRQAKSGGLELILLVIVKLPFLISPSKDTSFIFSISKLIISAYKLWFACSYNVHLIFSPTLATSGHGEPTSAGIFLDYQCTH